MKSVMLLLTLMLLCQISNAQSPAIKPSSTIKIEMLFPEGKSKALILSFDDGNTQDRKLVKLFNNYGLKGTFHLNSNKFDTKGYLSKSEIKSLFKGHEVSVHSANHPSLVGLSKIDILHEIVEDRKELEKLTGYIIRGMAYPFGSNNDFVVETINGLGIEYARTVNDTYNFSIPTNYLKWDPSIHQFGRAFFIPNNPENDKKEITAFNKLVDNFVQSDTLALFDLWGHSWENDGDGNRWEAMEEFCKRMSAQKDICSITQIDLVDYINAYKNLKISVDKKHIKNLSSTEVYIKKENKVIKIPAGVEITI
jgi:peptidoglycan/xylan/chitin deacetylase (PgdA/CDA1 family)